MSLTGPVNSLSTFAYGIKFVSKKKKWYIVIYHPHITTINKSKSTKASFNETFMSIK
jgi:hypothetical protein